MPILTILFVIAIAAFICWMVQLAPFISPWFKNLIFGVIAFAALLYIFGVFGVGPGVRLR